MKRLGQLPYANDKTCKVSRIIADLADSEEITPEDNPFSVDPYGGSP
ncbi:MAG: hypothetical protein J7M30_07970 [Deltaproteobacteria bacterium]|nr:hypothetical protein [Deltaproteobacteria bacterium]